MGSTELYGAKELWRVRAPPKVKFFFWLGLHNRLWTSDRRKRHGLQDDDGCALCSQASETVSHLLAGCVVTREVWFRVLVPVGLHQLMDTLGDEDVAAWWLQKRLLLDSEKRQGFDALVLLVSWEVWKERNVRIFRNEVSTVATIAKRIHDEGSLWIEAGFIPLATVWAFFDNAGVAQMSAV